LGLFSGTYLTLYVTVEIQTLVFACASHDFSLET